MGQHLATLLATVCLAGFAVAADQSEPAYQGRTLSDWTRDFASSGIYIVGHEPPAWTAIHHMGTNAIPTLLKWMSEPDPPEPPMTNVPPGFNMSRSERAGLVFRSLGEIARPAIPELTRLVRASSDYGRAWNCATSLADIGPEAIPSLLSLATNGPPLTRRCAFEALERFIRSPMAVTLVPVLIKCLGDEREDVVNGAASLLWLVDLPNVVVPALTNALQSSSALTRLWAVRCLGWHDDKAVSAIPLLRAAMCDTDHEVRVSATNALRGMGGWELDREWRWFRPRGTNTLHGITPDFFTNNPSR